MLDKIIDLYKNKPHLFWIFAIVLIPFIIILFLKGFLMSFLVEKANQTTKDAQLKDVAFKTAINSLSAQANTEKQQADSFGAEAEKVDVDTDWNKK